MRGGRRRTSLAVPRTTSVVSEGTTADKARLSCIDARVIGPSVRGLAMTVVGLLLTFWGKKEVADVTLLGLTTGPPQVGHAAGQEMRKSGTREAAIVGSLLVFPSVTSCLRLAA